MVEELIDRNSELKEEQMVKLLSNYNYKGLVHSL